MTTVKGNGAARLELAWHGGHKKAPCLLRARGGYMERSMYRVARWIIAVAGGACKQKTQGLRSDWKPLAGRGSSQPPQYRLLDQALHGRVAPAPLLFLVANDVVDSDDAQPEEEQKDDAAI